MSEEELRRSERGGVPTTQMIEEGYVQAEAVLSQALQTSAISSGSDAVGAWGTVLSACRKVKTIAKDIRDRYVAGG